MDVGKEKRIIGDFTEINADLIYQRTTSTEPKFIVNYRYKKFHKKLIKKVDKLRKSNHILSKDNLIELFAYCYNSYPPYGQYKSVYGTKIIDEDATRYEGIIKFDKCVSIICLDMKLENFDIHVIVDKEDGSKDSFTVELKELKSNNARFKNYIEDINNRLLNDMCDFIIDTLSAYDL